jgi:hypothetical protein
LISKETVIKELGFDPDKEYETRQEEMKKQIEISIKEAEGMAEAQGAGALVTAMYQADAQMENQKRLEMHDRKSVSDRDASMAKEKEQTSQAVAEEANVLAEGQPISVPNLLMVLTQRFARLAKYDVEEFKIRMLAMKNSMPNLYHEIYNNLKEMNLIQADTLPDLAEAQKMTPGQIPSFSQADANAEQPPDPVEQGAGLPSQVLQPPLPEQKPPVSPNAPI